MSGVTRVLVVEDDDAINDIVATALRHQGYRTTQVTRGDDGLAAATGEDFHLVVLDVNLPGLDGFEVCRRLRDAGRSMPVLFLTARDEQEDRIRGFVTGGDDYLTKPFSVDELILRVQAILRRVGVTEPDGLLRVGDLVLDPAGHVARRAGEPIDLSPTEFSLLHYLMVNTGVVLSKAQILITVWDEELDRNENVVELYIGYLRRKIDDGRTPLIHTQRGVGYVLRPQ